MEYWRKKQSKRRYQSIYDDLILEVNVAEAVGSIFMFHPVGLKVVSPTEISRCLNQIGGLLPTMVRLALPYVSFNLVPVFKSSLNALLLGAYNIPWLVVRLIVMTILWKFIHGQLSQLFNDGILCILAFILLLIPYTHFLYLPRQSLYCLVMLFVTAIDFTFLMALQAIDALIIYNIRLCVLALSFHIPPENHPTPMVPLPRQSTCMYRMPRLFADWLLL